MSTNGRLVHFLYFLLLHGLFQRNAAGGRHEPMLAGPNIPLWSGHYSGSLQFRFWRILLNNLFCLTHIAVRGRLTNTYTLLLRKIHKHPRLMFSLHLKSDIPCGSTLKSNKRYSNCIYLIVFLITYPVVCVFFFLGSSCMAVKPCSDSFMWTHTL